VRAMLTMLLYFMLAEDVLSCDNFHVMKNNDNIICVMVKKVTLFNRHIYDIIIMCNGYFTQIHNRGLCSLMFLTGVLPYTFYFGVKFYAADPCKLFEEITRYLLVTLYCLFGLQ